METSMQGINTQLAVNVKVVQLAKQQQEAQGQIAIQLVESAEPTQTPQPDGNLGHHINIKV